MNSCKNCGTQTTNPKFCSKSCAATFNNKISPKRTKKPHVCPVCKIDIPKTRQYCVEHNPQRVDWSKLTIQNVTDTAGKNANRYRRIRDHSRSTYLKSDKPKICMHCGYKKHFDVCHKVDIKDFPIDTPITTVNSLDNLIALCPNCHWETHNGFLNIHNI